MLFLCLCRKFHAKIQFGNVKKMNTGCTYAHFPKYKMLLHCSVFCRCDVDHIIDIRWVKTVSCSNCFIWIWHNLVSFVTKESRKWFYFIKTTQLCWLCCHAVETLQWSHVEAFIWHQLEADWLHRLSSTEGFIVSTNDAWVSTQSGTYLTCELNNLIELSHRQPSTATKTFTAFTDIGLVQGLSGNDKHLWAEETHRDCDWCHHWHKN